MTPSPHRLRPLLPAAGWLLWGLAACRSGLPCAQLDPQERDRILDLAAKDQEARSAWVEWGRAHPGESVPASLIEAVQAADRDSRVVLEELIQQGRWPCRSREGDEVAHAAWLLAQHADEDPDLQEAALELMGRLVPREESDGSDYALLLDRVRVAQGRPQVYGTQWLTLIEGGKLRFGLAAPLEDPEGVDARRAEVGLDTLAEYEATLRRVYGIPEDAGELD